MEDLETCLEGCKSRFCFPCVNGVCPYGRDFMIDCYPKLTFEQKFLFDMLFKLRAKVARRSQYRAVMQAFIF